MKNIIFLFVLTFSFIQCQMDVEKKEIQHQVSILDQDVVQARLGGNSCEPEVGDGCTVESGSETFYNVDLRNPCTECDFVIVTFDKMICRDANNNITSIDIFNVDISFCWELIDCVLHLGITDEALVFRDLLSNISVQLEKRIVNDELLNNTDCSNKFVSVTTYQRSCFYYMEGVGMQYCGEKCCTRSTEYCKENGVLIAGQSEFTSSGYCGTLGGGGESYECTNECALGIVRIDETDR